MEKNLGDIFRVIIKPKNTEGILITIGSLFLFFGLITKNEEAKIFGAFMVVVGILLTAQEKQ